MTEQTTDPLVDRIKKLKEKNDLSNNELARRAGVHQDVFRRIASGERKGALTTRTKIHSYLRSQGL